MLCVNFKKWTCRCVESGVKGHNIICILKYYTQLVSINAVYSYNDNEGYSFMLTSTRTKVHKGFPPMNFPIYLENGVG